MSVLTGQFQPVALKWRSPPFAKFWQAHALLGQKIESLFNGNQSALLNQQSNVILILAKYLQKSWQRKTWRRFADELRKFVCEQNAIQSSIQNPMLRINSMFFNGSGYSDQTFRSMTQINGRVT